MLTRIEHQVGGALGQSETIQVNDSSHITQGEGVEWRVNTGFVFVYDRIKH